MADYMLGEIRAFPFNWAPINWIPCDGRELLIAQNQGLYVLLGTNYGGDGKTKFNIPDLRGRVIYGAQYAFGPGTTPGSQGYKGGAETVALTPANLLLHNHVVTAHTASGNSVPMTGGGLASVVTPAAFAAKVYGVASGAIPNPAMLNSGTVSVAGAGAAHENMQPFQVLQYCICTSGLFPERS
ncbi:phage tail protein [Novispirillum itersonii]|uniref:Microcystin-dependent protein n=1 Tax=Novispirillum itersonii TaxID=189 RepID=A0A7W9ZEX3_NOVIT|nr:tail fiber protein [Novispirillum itersonii]MBB6210251.1 microcystin-dependent protein [Novispirillum itersonii]